MSDIPEKGMMKIQNAADIIRRSKKCVILTGAGISTPSGIPDFRSTTSGLWQRYDPFEVASLSSFRYNPEKIFSWMRPLANDIYYAKPNPAHYAITQLQQHNYIKYIITQNADGLHQKAGSDHVIEVHGSFRTMTCIACFKKQDAAKYIEDYIELRQIPRCPHCNEILKPDIILFGEQLPQKAWLEANTASKKCDLMIIAGSSLEVLPVANLPMRALENGAHIIIINNSQTYLHERADIVFSQDIALILPQIAEAVQLG